MSRLTLTRMLLLPLVVVGVLSHHLHAEGSGWDRVVGMAGLVLLLASMGGRIWASAYMAGKKDRVLVTEGPYSMVRHPLYMFSFLGFVGAGLAFESVTLALAFGLVFLVGHGPAILQEERRLEAAFGDAYRRYRARVPRLVPALGKRRTGTTLVLDVPRFSVALRECLAIPMIFVLVDLLEWAKLEGVIPVLLHLP